MMEWNPSTIRITIARRLLSARLVADMRVNVPLRRRCHGSTPANGPPAGRRHRAILGDPRGEFGA